MPHTRCRCGPASTRAESDGLLLREQLAGAHRAREASRILQCESTRDRAALLDDLAGGVEAGDAFRTWDCRNSAECRPPPARAGWVIPSMMDASCSLPKLAGALRGIGFHHSLRHQLSRPGCAVVRVGSRYFDADAGAATNKRRPPRGDLRSGVEGVYAGAGLSGSRGRDLNGRRRWGLGRRAPRRSRARRPGQCRTRKGSPRPGTGTSAGAGALRGGAGPRARAAHACGGSTHTGLGGGGLGRGATFISGPGTSG